MAKEEGYEKKHKQALAKIANQIDYLYEVFTKEVASLSVGLEGMPADKPFRLSDYPITEKRLKRIVEKLAKELDICIVNGVRSQWTLANKKNDELCNVVFGKMVDKLTKEQARYYYTSNGPALEAFLARKVKGLGLSQRVWNYADMSREMVERTLELGIKTGEPAAEIARDLKQYLKFPDRLYRRVRDEEGRLHLSKAASEFHPGPGVYRSSYKNALRLAATETNIAYRSSDHLRQVQLDFVVGIEVHLSNNHTCLDSKGKPQPFYDICDELKGKYPKWFDFKGWHPNCRCFITTILKTPEELARDADGIDRGSVNEVKSLPDNWNAWLERNRDRIDRAEARGTLPYFLRDNEWAWNDDIPMPGEEGGEPTRNALGVAIVRHASRTPEQIEDIKRRWNERQIAYNDAELVLRLADSIPDLEEYWKGTLELRGLKKLRKEYETGKFSSYGMLRTHAELMLGLLEGLRDEFKILDHPWEVLKKYNPFRAMNARDNALKTMSKYDGYSDEEKIDKYRYEANYIEQYKKGAFSTWEVVRDAYLKAARELEWKVIWEQAKKEFDAVSVDPVADPALVDMVRSYLGKDKAAFDVALEQLREQIKADVLITKIDEYRLRYKKLLTTFFVGENVDEAINAKDVSRLEYLKNLAEILIKHYEELKANAEALLADKRLLPETKQKLREAVNNQVVAPLADAINNAEAEQQIWNDSEFVLDPDNVKILEGLGFGNYVTTLRKALSMGEFDDARHIIGMARKKLIDWGDLMNDAADLIAQTPEKYAKPIRDALARYDRAALVGAMTKARNYINVLAPLLKELEEMEKKREELRARLEARKKELREERDRITQAKKDAKAAGDKAAYDKALADARTLRENEAKLEEAALAFKSWDVWVADGKAAIEDSIVEAAREALDELKETERMVNALRLGIAPSINPNALSWKLDNVNPGNTSDEYRRFLDITFDSANEVFKKMTWDQKRNIYQYTVGSGKFNRPLEGYDGSWGKSNFKGKGDVPFNNEGADSEGYKRISEAISQCLAPQDMWIYHGGDYQTFEGIFGSDLSSYSESEAKAKFVGMRGVRESFSSCSPTNPWQKDILFRIYCPKGTEVMLVSPMSRFNEVDTESELRRMTEMSKTASFGEKEILLNRGYTFQILSIRRYPDYGWAWEVEMVAIDRNSRHFD